MNFFEQDEPVRTTPPRRFGRDPNRRRQFLLRRLMAAGVGVLILILLVLGIRGCLNSRKQQAFEDYVGDLSTVASESSQLGENLFGRLDDPENLDEAELAADANAAESLLARAQSLDAPDEVGGAQKEVVLAFELRRDGVVAIASQAGALTGDEGTKAANKIAREVEGLVTSDALYRRARAEIDAVLREEGIDDQPPDAPFVPGGDPVEWLD